MASFGLKFSECQELKQPAPLKTIFQANFLELSNENMRQMQVGCLLDCYKYFSLIKIVIDGKILKYEKFTERIFVILTLRLTTCSNESPASIREQQGSDQFLSK